MTFIEQCERCRGVRPRFVFSRRSRRFVRLQSNVDLPGFPVSFWLSEIQ